MKSSIKGKEVLWPSNYKECHPTRLASWKCNGSSFQTEGSVPSQFTKGTYSMSVRSVSLYSLIATAHTVQYCRHNNLFQQNKECSVLLPIVLIDEVDTVVQIWSVNKFLTDGIHVLRNVSSHWYNPYGKFFGRVYIPRVGLICSWWVPSWQTAVLSPILPHQTRSHCRDLDQAWARSLTGGWRRSGVLRWTRNLCGF